MRRVALALTVVLLVAAAVVAKPVHHWWGCRVNRAATADPLHLAGRGLRVGVLGDSWSTGWGLPRLVKDAWAVEAARRGGWDLTLSGVPGSGYVNPGPCGGRAFLPRLSELPKRLDVLLIEGGLNDVGEPAVVRRSAAALVGQAERRWPAARVVVLAPPSVPSRAPGLMEAVRAALPTSVPLRPVPLQPDGLHPTLAGQQQLAQQVLSVVSERTTARARPPRTR